MGTSSSKHRPPKAYPWPNYPQDPRNAKSKWYVTGKGKRESEQWPPGYPQYAFYPQAYPTFQPPYTGGSVVPQMQQAYPNVQPTQPVAPTMSMPVPQTTQQPATQQYIIPPAHAVSMPVPEPAAPSFPEPATGFNQPQPHASSFPMAASTSYSTSNTGYVPPGTDPIPPSNNPLPPPPRDLYEMSPYRHLLKDLEKTSDLMRSVTVSHPPPVSRPPEERERKHKSGGLLGTLKKPKMGHGRSQSTTAYDTSRYRRESEPLSATLFNTMAHQYSNEASSSRASEPVIPSAPVIPPTPSSSTFSPTTAVPPPPILYPSSSTNPNLVSQINNMRSSTSQRASVEPQPAPLPAPPPAPVRFDHQSPLSGFLNHSSHRILHQNKMYPSALHLVEALKFLQHRPDLAERIRTCPLVQDVYPLSASFQDQVRSDWGHVFLQMMEEVLYLKFKQHPELRNLLLNTGIADIIYAEGDDGFWGEGPSGQGSNELGKALGRVRNRLRAEGHTGTN